MPINNETGNSLDTQREREGVDFWNAEMDINPENIASVSVLKVAATEALHGLQEQMGVILITAIKGKSKKRIWIATNSQTTVITLIKIL